MANRRRLRQYALDNSEIAQRLRLAARLLREQAANPFRVNAYLRAAQTIDQLGESLEEIRARGGPAALIALPTIGNGIAAAIEEMLRTGRWSQLERLQGSHDPEEILCTVPGVGPVLAQRIHDHLHVDSLEALEMAAHDGRLEELKGVGPRRCQAIRASLSEMLGRSPSRRRFAPSSERDALGPEVGALLEIDRRYQRDVAASRLQTIAPRRFNPRHRAWLPVGHYEHDGWHFTALFSNTARAHELRRIRDWVVIYFYDHDHREGQQTVVTETSGPLVGKRVVRGKEASCAVYYGVRHEGRRSQDVTGPQGPDRIDPPRQRLHS